MAARGAHSPIVGWLQAVRPANSLAATALLLIGAWQVGTSWPPGTAAAAISLWATAAFGYVTNDLIDLPADRISKPHRPLPSGRLSIAQARVGAALFALIALSAASLSTPLGIPAVLTALAALLFYSAHTKRVPLLGNVQIGLMAGAALVAGAWLRGTWRDALGPAAVVACYITGREVLKTAEDMVGDRLHGVHTVAVVWGAGSAHSIFALCMLLTALFSGIALFDGQLMTTMVLAAWDTFLLLLATVVLVLPRSQATHWGLRLTKVGYVLGLGMLLATRILTAGPGR